MNEEQQIESKTGETWTVGMGKEQQAANQRINQQQSGLSETTSKIQRVDTGAANVTDISQKDKDALARRGLGEGTAYAGQVTREQVAAEGIRQLREQYASKPTAQTTTEKPKGSLLERTARAQREQSEYHGAEATLSSEPPIVPDSMQAMAKEADRRQQIVREIESDPNVLVAGTSIVEALAQRIYGKNKAQLTETEWDQIDKYTTQIRQKKGVATG